MVVKIKLVAFWFITSRTVLYDNSPDRLWNPHSLRYDGYQGSFLGLMRPGGKFDHSHPPSSEIKKKWSYCSTPYKWFYGVDTYNVTFTFTFT
jgi:hypothetical protein